MTTADTPDLVRHDALVAPPIAYDVCVSGSSRDLPLTGGFAIAS